MLTNEKYVRHNIYNWHLFNLKKVHVVNPPEMWMEKESAFEAVVLPEVFQIAQGIICARGQRLQPSSPSARHGSRPIRPKNRSHTGVAISVGTAKLSITAMRSTNFESGSPRRIRSS